MRTQDESTSERQRQHILRRAHGRCETQVRVQVSQDSGAWTRCFTSPVEIHHMLTRSRGGDLLDRAGETYHLMALCNRHHRAAHEPGGYASGLMLEGYVTLDSATGKPYYKGPDLYLSKHYPVPGGQQ